MHVTGRLDNDRRTSHAHDFLSIIISVNRMDTETERGFCLDNCPKGSKLSSSYGTFPSNPVPGTKPRPGSDTWRNSTVNQPRGSGAVRLLGCVHGELRET